MVGAIDIWEMPGKEAKIDVQGLHELGPKEKPVIAELFILDYMIKQRTPRHTGQLPTTL